jgi:hypothetical protein
MEPRNDPYRIASSGPISFIHQTRNGPVHLLVRPSRAGWVSLHWDSKEAGTWTFKTLAEANENLLRHFRKLYSGHVCSAACRSVDAIEIHKSGDLWGLIEEEQGIRG